MIAELALAENKEKRFSFPNGKKANKSSIPDACHLFVPCTFYVGFVLGGGGGMDLILDHVKVGFIALLKIYLCPHG